MSSLLSFLSFLSVIIIFGCNIKSQSLTQENSKIKETYHWPVGGERIITGSFAEFRARNFHMGTDFGTEGKIGVPILALTNGKLLKIQSYRYSIGNAILIKHDDGFISRYGHMNHFSDRILKSIKNPSVLRKIKYREDFELKIKSKDSIKISKGEVIGYSGKTGIGPPHLHVELIKDNIYYNVSDHLNLSGHESSIFIDEIKLVPEDNKTFINGKQKSFVIKTIRGQDGNYYPISSEFIKIQGKVSVQVSSHEATGRANRLGMKKISLFLNEKELQNFDLTAVYQPDTIRSCFIFDNYVSNIRGRPFKYYTHSRDDDSINNLLNKQKDTGIIDFKELKKDENNFIKISVFGLKYKKSNFVFMVRPDFQKYNFPEIIEPFYNLFKGKELDLITKDKKFSVKFFGDSVFSKAYVSVLENKSINISTEGIKQVSPI
ncbi:MAG: M23 family metallopeptidase, partial [Leptospiraceae bacterium]|nr:M23 family metallopeptidase [Leptospiraceae bacterium]